MKTTLEYLKPGLKAIYQLHLITASWVAQQIGPIVFCSGAKKESWNISTQQLLNFPDASIGRALGEFLQKQQVEPLSKAEFHDVQHVLFGFSISFVDEVALQFFLRGNGIKTIASVTTTIGAWFILPFHWQYLKSSYQRGKQYKSVSIINTKIILQQNLHQVKHHLFRGNDD